MRKAYIYIIGIIVLFLLIGGCSNYKDNQVETPSNGIEVMHKNFEKKGLECKEIVDTVDRGDCFQSVNERYLKWNINFMKDFQYIYAPQQEEWQGWLDIFNLSINESDELVSTRNTDYYDVYLKENSLDIVQEKEDILNNYWYVFSNLFPKEYRKDLKRVMLNDFDGNLFYVGREESNINDIVLVLSDDIMEYDPFWYRWTLIHEFGHIMTTNKDQITVDSELYLSGDEEALKHAKAECATYFWYGCAKEASYINQYYLEFWEDTMADYEAIDWTVEEDHQLFYQKYEDHFFNAYQAMNVNEDIAESFTFFVMLNSVELEKQSDIKYEKVNYFYQYEDFVNLRAQILENLYDLSVRDNDFY